MKFIKGARTWRSILGTQTFFWHLTHPPPPRYSINQPLSKGLPHAHTERTPSAHHPNPAPHQGPSSTHTAHTHCPHTAHTRCALLTFHAHTLANTPTPPCHTARMPHPLPCAPHTPGAHFAAHGQCGHSVLGSVHCEQCAECGPTPLPAHGGYLGSDPDTNNPPPNPLELVWGGGGIKGPLGWGLGYPDICTLPPPCTSTAKVRKTTVTRGPRA